MTRLPQLQDATLRLEPIPEPLSFHRTARTLVPVDTSDPAWAVEVVRAQPSLDPTEPALPGRLVLAEWEDDVVLEEEDPLDEAWFDEDATLAPAEPRAVAPRPSRSEGRTRLLTRMAAAALVGALMGTAALALQPRDALVAMPLPTLPETQVLPEVEHVVVERGDTFTALVGDVDAGLAMASAARPLADLSLIEVGDVIELERTEGELTAVRYGVLVLERTDEGWRVSR